MITSDVIAEVTRRLVGVYDPEKIYLFGSYAWGHPDDESDLDLLVVLKDSTEKSHRRCLLGRQSLWGLDIAKDLMVYTQKEFDERVGDSTTLIYKIYNQGRVLYARSE